MKLGVEALASLQVRERNRRVGQERCGVAYVRRQYQEAIVMMKSEN